MRDEDERVNEKDYRDLRMRLLVAGLRPEQVPEVLKQLEGQTEDEEAEFAEELSDEDMESYVPYSVEESSAAIEQLRRFGMAVS